jgi:MinD-like ATPase involved in chromosome partitioning or flagellar assembly
MTSAHVGEVVTFYSYKGGVGRSAAVANVAVILAQRGKRVLAIDFDLEAPGLHRYFASAAKGPSATGDQPTFAGTIEFFEALRALFDRLALAARADSHATPLEVRLREEVGKLLDAGQYIRRVELDDPNRPGSPTELFLMHGGRFDESYAERVRAFPWDALYEDYPDFVDILTAELGQRFDYILVDSRTGTTDVGNLCTVLLPEKLVVVFVPNEQSLHGACEVGAQAVELRKASQDIRPLPLFPLISRVENAENDLQRRWIRDAQSRFEAVFNSVYGTRKPLATYFDVVQIPHKSFYAYGEQIAACRERVTEVHSLAAAFRGFVDALTANSAIEAQELLRQRLTRAVEASEPAPGSEQGSQAFVQAPDAALAPAPAAPALAASPVVAQSRAKLGLRVIAAAVALLAAGLLALVLARSSSQKLAPADGDLALQALASSAEASTSERPIPLEPPPASSSETGSRLPDLRAPGIPVKTGAGAVVPGPPALPPSVDQALLTTLTLHTSSHPRPARTASNKALYDFKIWIEGPADAVDRIESVNYFFDHPSFSTKHLISTVGPDFTQGYIGWGCLSNVSVTILWKSGSTSSLPFDQCAAL